MRLCTFNIRGFMHRYRFLTVILCLCMIVSVASAQTEGTAKANQAGLNVKVTETGNGLPVQMATVYGSVSSSVSGVGLTDSSDSQM